MSRKDSYYIPFEISTQVYQYKNATRAYISNEKEHEYFLLEGLSAKLWKLLIDYNDKNIQKFAKDNGLENELDIFFNELLCLGLLKNKEDRNKQLQTFFENKESKTHLSQLKFEERMNNWLKKRNFLQRLLIELTYKCNLKCIHCYNEKDNKKNEELTFPAIKKIIDEAHKLGMFNVVLSGGEATLSNEFYQIAKYIREKKLSLEIYTNGQVLYENEKLLEDLIKLYPHRVSLSLYSLNEEIHEKITGVKGSFKKTINVIRKLKENNISVGIKCFLTKYNVDSYLELKEFAKENKLSLQVDCKFINNENNKNKNVQLTQEQLLKLYSDKKSLFKVKKFSITEEFKKSTLCSAGQTSLTINPNLNVYCCPTLQLPLGNLKNETITTIWKNNNPTSTLYKIRETKKQDLKECWKDEFCQYCIYCPGIAFLENKYLKKHKPFCIDAKCRMNAYVKKRKSQIK